MNYDNDGNDDDNDDDHDHDDGGKWPKQRYKLKKSN